MAVDSASPSRTRKFPIQPRLIVGLVLFGVAIAATLLAPNTYYLFMLGMVAITTLVGVGLNILVGLSGQVSIGHAGFFAIGAYVGSLLMTRAGWNVWFALIAAIIATAGTGAALAAPALRVTGPYLAMVTIAFGVIVERVLIEWVSLTGGFGGIMNIPKPQLFGLEPALRDVVLIAMGLAFLAMLSFAFLKQHPWGRAFEAVRDDEVAAMALGLNTLTIRVMAFALSAGFTGLAGVFFASTIGFVSPDSFTFHRSILFLLVVILGGLGTPEGALIGAIALVILPEFFQDFADYQLLFFGLLLLAVLWLAPNGVMSLFRRWSDRQSPVFPLDAPPEHLALMPSEPALDPLSVKQVGITFGGIRAVEDVDLLAKPGTVTAVIGPNGAGKTTLLNLIGGFYKTQTGSIHLGETNLTRQSSVAIAAAGVSRTFQATRLFSALSVIDNLRVARSSNRLGNVVAALVGKGRSRAPEKPLLELLSFVGYHGDVHQTAKNLPFVDRRLVEIARALATQPQVMLLDEPAAGLSKTDKATLAQLIRRIASSGIKVILIEHDMDLVMDISDSVVVLDSGKVISEGNPATVQADPQVLEAYLGAESPELGRSPTSQSDSPLLDIQNLYAGYGSLPVLHDLSLTVYPGELVSVVGANGAGKSTLLKTIVSSLPIQSGQIQFQDKSITRSTIHQLVNAGMSLVPEGRQVFAKLSVIDNIRLGAFSRSDAEIESDINAMLERFPRLAERRHQPAGLLSGGEQQMLAIARGLMARPTLLLLDEPSLGLAPKLVVDLYETLAALRDEGITILLVDQMATLALSVSDRAYLLETGRIVQSGLSQDMQNNPAILQAYLGVSQQAG